MEQEQEQDRSSLEYQRRSWEDLDKGINGLLSRLDFSNINAIIPQLFELNLILGRGLFSRYCIQSVLTSPQNNQVFASVVAQVNARFPVVVDLLLRRIIHQLIIAYDGNDKHALIAAVKFIAHLTNQRVAHECIALQILDLLLVDPPASDKVQAAVELVEECGGLLRDSFPHWFDALSEQFRAILEEGEVDERTQASIHNVFGVRRGNGKFEVYPELEQQDQAPPAFSDEHSIQHDPEQFDVSAFSHELFTQHDPEQEEERPVSAVSHQLSIDPDAEQEEELDVYQPDPQFLEHQRAYEKLKAGINPSREGEEEEANGRHTLYSSIMTTTHYELGAHNLLNRLIEPGREMDLCIMALEYFNQGKIYFLYYARLAERLCMINKAYQENFDKCFLQRYSITHTLEKNRIRNDARFFAHLLAADALPWHCLAYIRLTEEDTTTSSLRFIKILFRDLLDQLGLGMLSERLNDPTMLDSYNNSIFPKDNLNNSLFAIKFWTSIGLGTITQSMRAYLESETPGLLMGHLVLLSDDDSPGSTSESENEHKMYEEIKQSIICSGLESKTDSDSGIHTRKRKMK